MSKTATAAAAPIISTIRAARVNLRIIAGCSLPHGPQGRPGLNGRGVPGDGLLRVLLRGLCGGLLRGSLRVSVTAADPLGRAGRGTGPNAAQAEPGWTADPSDTARNTRCLLQKK